MKNSNKFPIIGLAFCFTVLFTHFTVAQTLSLTPLSRTQILANANSYSDAIYTWQATSKNLKWGYVCNNKIVYYASPSGTTYSGCVVVGTNWGMPYCWGGNSNTVKHNALMAQNFPIISAGDICSTTGTNCSGYGAGENCASGMDCSGFVQRCWLVPNSNPTLAQKYGTYDFDPVSVPIEKAYLKAGDILVKGGDHVMTFVQALTSTQFKAIEASKSGLCRVQQNTRTYTFVSSYTARVFNNTASCGNPYNATSTKTGTSVTINWSGTASKYYVYLKKSASSLYKVYGPYTAKPVTITGLINTTSYQYFISNECSDGSWGIRGSGGSSVVKNITPYTFTTLRIGEISDELNEVTLNPNPISQNQTFFINNLPENTEVKIYDTSGILINTLKTNNSSEFQLPTEISNGIYLLSLTTQAGSNKTLKLVVM